VADPRAWVVPDTVIEPAPALADRPLGAGAMPQTLQ